MQARPEQPTRSSQIAKGGGRKSFIVKREVFLRSLLTTAGAIPVFVTIGR